jgi:hypothetical protein
MSKKLKVMHPTSVGGVDDMVSRTENNWAPCGFHNILSSNKLDVIELSSILLPLLIINLFICIDALIFVIRFNLVILMMLGCCTIYIHDTMATKFM